MKMFLFGHGGSGNHGCEAIVRSTCAIFNQSDCTLFSYHPHEDKTYAVDSICRITDLDCAVACKKNWDFVKAYAALKLQRNYVLLDRHRETSMLVQQ